MRTHGWSVRVLDLNGLARRQPQVERARLHSVPMFSDEVNSDRDSHNRCDIGRCGIPAGCHSALWRSKLVAEEQWAALHGHEDAERVRGRHVLPPEQEHAMPPEHDTGFRKGRATEGGLREISGAGRWSGPPRSHNRAFKKMLCLLVASTPLMFLLS